MIDDKIEHRMRKMKKDKMLNLLDTAENYNLSLRKAKLEQMLMTKRTQDYQSSFPYEINIFNLDISQEFKDYSKTLMDQIKSNTFEVKTIWQFLFSNEISKVKYALYFLDRFITAQHDNKIPFISRNDLALVTLLCSLLRHSDIQIKITSVWCLINITFYPEKIEGRLSSPENLTHIYQAILESDIILLPLLIDLVRNCCADHKENRIFLLKKNILDYYCIILKSKEATEEHKVKILKCAAVLSKAVFDQKDFVFKFRDILIALMSLIIRVEILEEHFTFISLLLDNLTNSSSQLFDIIIIPDFITVLFKMYYSKDTKNKYRVLNLIINWLSGDDSSTQVLIDHGVINILKTSLTEFSNEKIALREIVWGVSNIVSGTLGQCELVENSGLLIDIMTIAKNTLNEIKNSHLVKDNEGLLKEILYSIGNCITGGLDSIKYHLLQFENAFVIELIVYGLEKFQSDKTLIWLLLSTIRTYIILEENFMSDASIKKMLINSGAEDILNQLFGREKNERNLELIEIVLSSIKE